MNKEELQKRRQEVEDRFNALSNQKEETELEMHRLQGEYRLLGDLIENHKEEAKKKEDK